ncbi:MAG: beta-galactosidase [Lachnospiraceae bacterium]|nr:beta-galactosidase [Lachnospiraceae bacterium]
MKLKKILHGGDYNPEQWLDYPEILEKDITYFQLAKINTVTIGMFSWSTLEPTEGVFQFEWLEEIINRLYAAGISTILASPSGARPKWMADRYPEVLRVREDRTRLLFGGRHNHCYTSPIYREKIEIINRVLGERFGHHPAVILWHISNEYGGDCHCPLCQEAFQAWLKNRYGCIEHVNRSWNTTFWSHTYQSFEQIESPSSIGETLVHGLTLDWKRFVTDQTVDFCAWEIKALKASGSAIPTTTNLMYDFVGLNYDKMASIIDIVSWDTYPVWHKREDIKVAWDNGMQHDYMRCLKHKPFLLMESCPSSTNWQAVSRLKRPGLLKAQSWQAVAHGSESVLYFQMRQSRGSSEKFHGAVVDHYGGCDTRVFREIAQLGGELENLPGILGSETRAKVALIYDIENRWAVEGAQGPRNEGLYYHRAAVKSYQALRKQGINVDVISMVQDLSKYKLVVAPMLYMFRAGIEEKIRTFVKGGGHFVLGYWSGIVDENDSCFLGGTPYKLMDVFGLRRTETDGLYAHESNSIHGVADLGDASVYKTDTLCDLLDLNTAEALYCYGEEFYQGTAAVTKNRFGSGVAYYIGSDAMQAFYDDFYGELLHAADVEPLVTGEIPKGIAINSREGADGMYLFLQNYNNEVVDISALELTGTLMQGENKNRLDAYETLIIKK